MRAYLCGMVLLSLLVGCSEPETVNWQNTIANLEGIIETNKDQFVVGEPIKVTVYLKNLDQIKVFQAGVGYQREDPSLPIQSVSFNAVNKEDDSFTLIPKTFPTPFEGSLNIAPKEKVKFMEMSFTSEQGGEYILSCNIEWRINRAILMPDKHVLIRSTSLNTIRFEDEIPPKLHKQITQNIFNLKSNDKEENGKAAKALLEGGGPARFLLVKYLAAEDPQLSQYCLYLLMEMKKDAKNALLIGMRSKKDDVRWKCCFALEKLEDPSLIVELMKFLEVESSSRIRIRIVSLYISMIEKPIAQWALLQAMKNEDRVIRKMAFKRMRDKQKDLTFDVSASFKIRRKQIEAWEDWWKKAHPTIKLPTK